MLRVPAVLGRVERADEPVETLARRGEPQLLDELVGLELVIDAGGRQVVDTEKLREQRPESRNIQVGPVQEREPVPPLKFAQLVGLLFAIVGVVGFTVGPAPLGEIATGFALVAAFLNAAFGICLGCQLYPLATRLRRTPTSA